jgi:hypothetical protein
VDPLSFFPQLIFPERNKEGPYATVAWSLGADDGSAIYVCRMLVHIQSFVCVDNKKYTTCDMCKELHHEVPGITTVKNNI